MANSQVNALDSSYTSYISSAPAGQSNSPRQGHVVPEAANGSQPVGSSQVNISQEARDRLQGEASARDVKTAIGQRLSQMKEALTEIVKQYPPYSVEDRRRVAYLQLFSGLRKEIEALTAPLGQSVEQSAKAAAQVPVLDPVKASDQEVVAAVRSVEQALRAA
ncbi:hypothetical protein EDC61_11730 [Sulfuritortus calidifontis]|uniref:Uncharacterized protein n=1 Tax=Sulfuritortus calidifontis TaxID=1914471 RepID=A0A4R3JV13_9PROT|nr:hypothetical protein [Sulfuritortus calidifontis]TCS70125.1 hypothetical protein EDC61_11730 [Sulfuritortus calidifontis]